MTGKSMEPGGQWVVRAGPYETGAALQKPAEMSGVDYRAVHKATGNIHLAEQLTGGEQRFLPGDAPEKKADL